MRLVIFAILFAAGSVFTQTPASVERELLGHLENISKYGYGDSRNYERLEKENEILRRKLTRYGRRIDILRYRFPKLKEKMFITTSDDGRLRIYSWDTISGGSAQWFENVFQYRGRYRTVHALTPESSEGNVCQPFYHQIFDVGAVDRRIYLANSTAICSTSLAVQNLSIFRIDGEKLNSNVKAIRTKSGLTNSIGFQYDFFSVVNRPERPIKLFFFDETKREFRFPVVIEDEKTPQGRVTDKFITYRFNGEYFLKIR